MFKVSKLRLQFVDDARPQARIAPGGNVLDPVLTQAKQRSTWNLGAPRTTALEERGIQADEFCTVTWSKDRRWKVMRAMDKKKRGTK